MHDEHHGPPPANRSSRVDHNLLGMLLFIISEIMVFGAFFTAYFFIRVVGRGRVAGARCRAAEADRGLQHRDPRLVLVHAALGRGVHQERQPRRLQGGDADHVPARLHVPVHPDQRVRQPADFHPQTDAQGTIFYGLTGLHGAHVFIGLTLLLFVVIRAFRGHFSSSEHRGVEVPGIYWHFVDVMWIVVYTTVYLI